MKGVVSGCLKLSLEGFITGVNVICTNYRKRSIYISFPVLVKGQVVAHEMSGSEQHGIMMNTDGFCQSAGSLQPAISCRTFSFVQIAS